MLCTTLKPPKSTLRDADAFYMWKMQFDWELFEVDFWMKTLRNFLTRR